MTPRKKSPGDALIASRDRYQAARGDADAAAALMLDPKSYLDEIRPAIEAEVLARGFERHAEKQHLLFRYATILTALAAAGERLAQPPAGSAPVEPAPAAD